MKTAPDDSSTATAEQPAAGNGGEPGDMDMLRIAMEADQATDSALGAPAAGATPENKTTKDGKPDSAKDAKKPGEQGADREKPAEDKHAKPGEQGDTKFTAAKKEQERRDKSWQSLDKEKQEFRAEKGALVSQLEGLRREVSELRRSRSAQPAGPAKDANGCTASDYDALAKRYKDEGNDALAQAASERAETLRKQAPSTAAPAANTPDSPEFQQEWQRHTQELIQADPELANPENPLVRATNSLVNDPTFGRFFRSAPDGIRAAVEVAKLMRSAHGAQETQKQLTAAQEELTKSKAEIERLNGLLQPRGSHPAGPTPGEKKAGDLTDDDVRQIAAAADRGEL